MECDDVNALRNELRLLSKKDLIKMYKMVLKFEFGAEIAYALEKELNFRRLTVRSGGKNGY